MISFDRIQDRLKPINNHICFGMCTKWCRVIGKEGQLDVSQGRKIRSKYIVEFRRENCTLWHSKTDPTFCRALTSNSNIIFSVSKEGPNELYIHHMITGFQKLMKQRITQSNAFSTSNNSIPCIYLSSVFHEIQIVH
jgi:hypothetical protein